MCRSCWAKRLTGAKCCDQDDRQRVFGQAGIRTSLPIWAVDPAIESHLFNLHGLSHKISLEGEVSFTDASEDVDDFPLYDEIDDNNVQHFRRRLAFQTFGAAPPVPPEFDERFYGVRRGLMDSVTGPTEIADDLEGRAARRSASAGRPSAARPTTAASSTGSRWIRTPRCSPTTTRTSARTSDLLDYDFRWHVGDRLTLLSDGAADFFSQGGKLFSLGASLNRPPRGNLFLGFRSLEGPIVSNVLLASYSYRMSPKWASSLGLSYDLSNEGAMGETFTITRIGESFLFSIGFNADQGRDNVGVAMALRTAVPAAHLVRPTHGDCVADRRHEWDRVIHVAASLRDAGESRRDSPTWRDSPACYDAAMHAIDWTLVVFLNGAVVIYALLAPRLSRSRGLPQGQTSQDWFLGGRSIAWWIVGLSAFATAIDSSDLVADAGGVYSLGIRYFVTNWVGTVLGWMLLAHVIAVPMYRAGMYTNSEYLESRFGPAARVISSLIQVQYRTMVMANISTTMFLTFAIVGGLEDIAWLLVVAIVLAATAYTMLGGSRSVALADAVQSAVMITASVILFVVVWNWVGGWSGIEDNLAAEDPALPQRMMRIGEEYVQTTDVGNESKAGILNRLLLGGEYDQREERLHDAHPRGSYVLASFWWGWPMRLSITSNRCGCLPRTACGICECPSWLPACY